MAAATTDASSGVCLIGWSQLARYDGEPLAAWAEALRQTGVPATEIDSLDVVFSSSWPYDDPPARVAEAVGATPKRLHYSGLSGTMPLVLLSAAAERIRAGESRVCAIVGGEALATVRQLKKAGERPAWSHRHPEKQGYPLEAPFHPAEVAHQVFQAYTTFALRDIARRARLGTEPAEHRRRLGELFAPMTAVAAANPYAWFPAERTAEELSTVSPTNRMVDYPYTKLLVSIMDVDLSAALVVASVAAADELGVPEDHRVHLRGWAGAQDPDYVAEHVDLSVAPGMRHAFTHALRRSGLSLEEIDCADLYSCFPSSVSFALDALEDLGDSGGTSHLAPFTVTGGLPYAGGAGSNYVLASTASMCDRLTSGDGASNGLVTGVGMHLSKHQAMVVSTTPGPLGEPAPAFTPERRPIVDTYDGDVAIATYTVRHGGDGAATEALLITDVDPAGTGARGYAVARNPELLEALEAEEWVGRTVRVTAGDGSTPNVAVAVAP